MIAPGDKGEAILLIKLSPQRYQLACFGRKKHYRKDGSCKHTQAVLDSMKPWYRSRTRLTPFGKWEVEACPTR